MYPAERGSYVTLPVRLSQWDFNYGPAIDRSTQISDFRKDDRRQMNKRGIAFIAVDIRAVVSKMSEQEADRQATNMRVEAAFYIRLRKIQQAFDH